MVTEKELLETDPDYLCLKRYGNSLKTLEARYTTGVPEHLVAQAFNKTEEEIEIWYMEIIAKLRSMMGV